jgi:hypothetical protein
MLTNAYATQPTNRPNHKPQPLPQAIAGYAVYQRIGYSARRVMTYHGYDAKGMADRLVITLNQHNCLPGYHAFCEAIYE